MNEDLWFLEVPFQQGVFWSDEHDHILLVEPLHRIVAENPGANRVNSFVASSLEMTHPVRQILRVNVVSSGWPRNGRGKQYARGEGCQIINETARSRIRKVLRNFQADREVEHSVELEWLRQIAGQESAFRDPQLRTIDVVSIDAPYVWNTPGQKLCRPGPTPQPTSITLFSGRSERTSGTTIAADRAEPSTCVAKNSFV